MKKKVSIPVLVIFAMGLLAFYVANRATEASEQQKGAGTSTQDLNARVAKLEAQVAALQAQLKELASKASSRFIAIPGTQNFPGNKIPRGAIEREFNGMKYWILPINEGK